jgi:hypothetical protein
MCRYMALLVTQPRPLCDMLLDLFAWIVVVSYAKCFQPKHIAVYVNTHGAYSQQCTGALPSVELLCGMTQ